MAAGKSTIAGLLAEQFERGVYLEGDFFRRSVVAGRHEMTPDASAQALAQLRLRYRLTAMVADTYFDQGFNVALEDIVAGPLLSEYVGLIRSRPLQVVVLIPSIDAVAEREAARGKKGYTRWSIEQLYKGFTSETPRIGHWLDSSKQTPEETVAEILSHTVGLDGTSSPSGSEFVSDGVTYRWRGPLTDAEMVELIGAHGGNAEVGWWERIHPHSLGWVTAREGSGRLIGFVNVASDGGDHAFLIDTKTHGAHQHRGIGKRIVHFAAQHAKEAGCEWLHVDFDAELAPFYFDACGFRPTDAGLIHLPSLGD